MKELVIFDLDNTLINDQIQKVLLKHLFEKGVINLFLYLKIVLWFLLYRLKILKNPKKIMEYGFSFLRDKKTEELEKIVDEFFKENLNKHIFKNALKIIQEHKSKNRIIIIISNSPQQLLERMSKYLYVDYFIGTRLELKNGKFTGKIENDIMYGENKVKALKNFAQENNLSLENSWAYSDHESDIPLLTIVFHPVVVNPISSLRKIAKVNNWPILLFKETLNK